MEILIELLVNLIYFNNYYYYLTLQLSEINDNRIFIQTTILHIFSEMCHTIIRFSTIYFQFTSKFIQFMQEYWSCNNNKNTMTMIISLVIIFV